MGSNNKAVDNSEETRAEFQGSSKTANFENFRKNMADKLHHAAETLGENAQDQPEQSNMGQFEQQASEWLDQSAKFIQEFDVKQADAKVRDYIRQNPGRTLLIAGAAGLLIGAYLRRR